MQIGEPRDRNRLHILRSVEDDDMVFMDWFPTQNSTRALSPGTTDPPRIRTLSSFSNVCMRLELILPNVSRSFREIIAGKTSGVWGRKKLKCGGEGRMAVYEILIAAVTTDILMAATGFNRREILGVSSKIANLPPASCPSEIPHPKA